MKAKIKSYDGKVNIHFYENKIVKEGVFSVCLSKLLKDSVFKIDKHCSPGIFFEYCRCKEKKMSIFINEAIEISSDESDKDLSDDELPDKE